MQSTFFNNKHFLAEQMNPVVMMWTVFGPKGQEVTGGWRNLRNEEPHNVNSSPDTLVTGY
jgi:hypothetical protein